jgi:hypothetical protein
VSRDTDLIKTFLVHGTGPQTVPVEEDHEAVVETISVASVTGGEVNLRLDPTVNILFGQMPASDRFSEDFLGGWFVGGAGFDVTLGVPDDAKAYIGGYFRHRSSD